MWSYIPEEIILNILSKLQVKTLFRFRCVCKSWSNLLTSHDFVRMHLNHHAFDENNDCSFIIENCGDFYLIDSVSSSSSELRYEAAKIDLPFKPRLSGANEIFGPCNGLLWVATNCGDTFFIWNPCTKEYREISGPPITSQTNYIAYGFGYDCKIDDYKLVRIEYSSDSANFNLEVKAYTLGSNSWRNVQSVPLNYFVELLEPAGVHLNGSLHWIDCLKPKVIISFDIELPHCLFGTCTSNVGVLRGDLSVVSYLDQSHDLWVMKDYGVRESWTKLFSIAGDIDIFYNKLVHTFKNGEILFWVQVYMDDTNTLVSYDPKHGRARTLKIQGVPKFFGNIEAYVGSLVSPKQVLLLGHSGQC